MTTSEHSQATLWDELISSLEASHASRSPSPGSDEARRMTVGSGRKWLGLFQKSDPVSCWLKMLLGSSRWDSTIVSLTWKASVTKRGRLYFRLRVSAPGTGATGSGYLLPTPDVGMATGGRVLPVGTSATGTTPDGRKVQVGLSNAVRLLPTPRTEGFDAGAHRGNPDSLHAVVKLLPTPSVAGNHNRAGASPTSGDGLSTVVKRLLPTPHANSHTGIGEHGDGGPNLQTAMGGSLSPDFVTWMMGYPKDWLDLDSPAGWLEVDG